MLDPVVRPEGTRAAPSATMTSSLDQFVAGSQGMIGKRIDLALLDGQELLSRSAHRFALITTALLLALGGWFAWTWAFATWAAPDGNPLARLTVFGALQFVAAVAVVALARRSDS